MAQSKPDETPMMRQFYSLKEKHPDAVLLFRCGDFYEKMFLEELGLEESGVNRLVKSAFSLLNLETFITAGPMEVKAWTYRKGWKAPQCAGVIHTDFEKGFIRAEVIKYNDYVELGSEAAVRDAGKLYVEGKDYVVEDGDIMHFRFNV